MEQNVIEELLHRGFIDQLTSEELVERKGPTPVYVGFDPTADSLHLGNLVGIVALRWFQKGGHPVYPLLGGATGLIGDPSGKSKERNLLDENTLQSNIRNLEAFFAKILPSCQVLNNRDWLGPFSFVDFLRDVGKYFRIGTMLGKEMVRVRLQSEEGMSFTEFSYQLLQAYDFYYLNKEYGVCLQMGGSDQWGNITAGIEFNRKMGGKPIYGATFPLLTRSDGQKFGKSESGAIWLSSEKLSPYEFYQYLYRISDADVIRLLRMLTFLPLKEIDEVERQMKESPQMAQKKLAEEVTLFVHGAEGLKSALEVTENMRPGGKINSALLCFEELIDQMPHISVEKKELIGTSFVDLAVRTGLCSSKGEVVRLVQNKGAYLNDHRIEILPYFLEEKDLIQGHFLVLSAGKKKRLLISIVEK